MCLEYPMPTNLYTSHFVLKWTECQLQGRVLIQQCCVQLFKLLQTRVQQLHLRSQTIIDGLLFIETVGNII